jgi:PAS domain S-box-containing protein
VIKDEQGRTVKTVGANQDITERKQAEETLRQNEALMRTVIDSTPDWIFIKDRNHYYRLVNQSYANSMHLSPEDFVGKDDLEIGFPEEIVKGNAEKGIKGFWADDREVMDKGETKFITEEPAVLDGQPAFLSTIKVPLHDGQNQVWGVLGFVRNITERKQTEEALRENETRLSEALAIVRLAYWEFEVASQTFTFNDQFYSLFRTTAAREGVYQMMAADYAQRFVHPDDTEVIGTEVRLAVETTDPSYKRELEHRIVRADGTEGYIAIKFKIEKDTHGRTIKIIGTNQDITENKQAELERERLLADVEAAYRRYVRREWDQFLGEQHQGEMRVEHQAVDRLALNFESPTPDTKLAGLQAEVIDQGKTKVVAGVKANGHSTEPVIVAPLTLRGQTIGTLSLQDLVPDRQWSAEEVALVETVSEQLALTVENLRLFEGTQKQATREQLTRQITDKMRAAPDIDTIIQTGLAELAKALDVSRAYVKLTTKPEND